MTPSAAKIIPAPGIGHLLIEASHRGVCAIRILSASTPHHLPLPTPRGHAILRQVTTQLRAYVGGRLTAFTCPIDLQGPPFQRKVWRALLRIPYGKTRTYGQVARVIGRPRAGRAVGMACGQNPVAIIIPCHRVVGSNGRLTGYSAGLRIKQKFLRLEHRFNRKGGNR